MGSPEARDGSLHPPSSPNEKTSTSDESRGEESRSPKAKFPIITSWIPPSRSFENHGQYSVIKSLRNLFKVGVWESLPLPSSMSSQGCLSSSSAVWTEPNSQFWAKSLEKSDFEELSKSKKDAITLSEAVNAPTIPPQVKEAELINQGSFELFGDPQASKVDDDLISFQKKIDLPASPQQSRVVGDLVPHEQSFNPSATPEQSSGLTNNLDSLERNAVLPLSLPKASKFGNESVSLEHSVALPVHLLQYQEDEISLHSWDDTSTDNLASPSRIPGISLISNPNNDSLYLDVATERQIRSLMSKRASEEVPSVNDIWNRVLQLRERVIELREQYQLQRNLLHTLQDAKAAADEEYMKSIRTRHAILPNPLNLDEKALGILEELRNKCQRIRNQYGPEENDLGFIEERLRDEETKLTRAETMLLKRLPANLETDIQFSDAPSIQSSEQGEPEENDLYEEFLTRLGNADLLRESLGDLEYERDRLLEEQVGRQKRGLDLESDDLDYLDNYPRTAAETRRELAEVETDVARLRLLCVKERLIESSQNPSPHTSRHGSDHALEQTSEHTSERAPLSPFSGEQREMNAPHGERRTLHLECSETLRQNDELAKTGVQEHGPFQNKEKGEIPIKL